MKAFITGITGTIGRAFTQYLTDKYEIEVTGIDHNEASVAQFKRDFPHIKVTCGDFGDIYCFDHDVDVLIHLAASKHIDLCEESPNNCVLNNVVKTQHLFRTALEHEVGILFMSTDKAVEPSSVYGYSKALGEAMAIEYGGAFIRSGNVIASNGSVLGIWDEQIENKLPVKVTHKDMRRYFISADNLVKRAWDLYLKGEREIIPKMDKNVKLVDLLEEKLSSHGYTLENYPYGIEYTGLRLAEKLEEKLQWQK